MNKIILSTILASAIFSMGCSTIDNAIGYKSGTPISQEQISTFTIGETTWSQVVKTLGFPQQQQTINGNNNYVYKYTEINHFAAGKDEQARFIFDKDGRLTEIKLETGSNKNPLLGG